MASKVSISQVPPCQSAFGCVEQMALVGLAGGGGRVKWGHFSSLLCLRQWLFCDSSFITQICGGSSSYQSSQFCASIRSHPHLPFESRISSNYLPLLIPGLLIPCLILREIYIFRVNGYLDIIPLYILLSSPPVRYPTDQICHCYCSDTSECLLIFACSFHHS